MSEFDDWQPAPNIRDAPDLYEIENNAFDRSGLVSAALSNLAPWDGLSVVDLGCGTGFWLPSYRSAAVTMGVEPDPDLRAMATQRVAMMPTVSVIAGSASHLQFPDSSIDVIHARFAYFWGPGAEAGINEVLRVLRPGGTFVMIDNDWGVGEFASLLNDGMPFASDRTEVDAWWSSLGASRTTVMSDWQFDSRSDLENVLRNEFRDGVADRWLDANPDRTGLSYGYLLYAITKPAQSDST